MKVNKMLKILKTLVLLATVSCGYTSNLNNSSKNNNYTGKINYSSINNTNNNDCNITNIIVNNNNCINSINTTSINNYVNNAGHNFTNNIGNSNSNISNNINNPLNKRKYFLIKKRKRYKELISNNYDYNDENNNKSDSKNNEEIENNNTSIKNNNKSNDKNNEEIDTNEYYNNLFGENYSKEYYYESIKQYLIDNTVTAKKLNEYIMEAYRIFTVFYKNLKYAIHDYYLNNEHKNDIEIDLHDLKRYEMLCSRFKFKDKNRVLKNDGLSYLTDYIKTQTKCSISIDEFYNYIVNKTAKLYNQTINALNKSIEQNNLSDKQDEIIINSKEILDFIVTSIGNTHDKVYVYDLDREWITLDQLYDVDENFINLETNLITKLDKYNNTLISFLKSVANADKNKNIIINGVNNIKTRNNIKNLLEKLNIENYSNYKEIKDFFTNDSLNLKAIEYFELFKKHSSNLKDILTNKIIEVQKNNAINIKLLNDPNLFASLIEKNSFDNLVYPYFKIIKNSLNNIIFSNSIVDNNNNITSDICFNPFNDKLNIKCFFCNAYKYNTDNKFI